MAQLRPLPDPLPPGDKRVSRRAVSNVAPGAARPRLRDGLMPPAARDVLRRWLGDNKVAYASLHIDLTALRDSLAVHLRTPLRGTLR